MSAVEFEGTPEDKALALLNRARRLRRLIQVNAPPLLIERERQLVLQAAGWLEPEDKSFSTDALDSLRYGREEK